MVNTSFKYFPIILNSSSRNIFLNQSTVTHPSIFTLYDQLVREPRAGHMNAKIQLICHEHTHKHFLRINFPTKQTVVSSALRVWFRSSLNCLNNSKYIYFTNVAENVQICLTERNVTHQNSNNKQSRQR